jgi:hypothetical protein
LIHKATVSATSPSTPSVSPWNLASTVFQVKSVLGSPLGESMSTAQVGAFAQSLPDPGANFVPGGKHRQKYFPVCVFALGYSQRCGDDGRAGV